MNSSDDDSSSTPFLNNDTTPLRPSKGEEITRSDYKEWIKERQAKGRDRFNRKKKASTKRGVNISNN